VFNEAKARVEKFAYFRREGALAMKGRRFFSLLDKDWNYYYGFKEDTHEFIKKDNDLNSNVIFVPGDTLSCSNLYTARKKS